MNLTFYTMDEVLAKSSMSTTFNQCLASFANLTNVTTTLTGNYSDWYGLWTQETDDAKVKAECISMVTRWTSWLKMKAIYWNDYMTRQKAFSGKNESISKYLDTPETSDDYSGDSHITNISKSETSQDNQLGFDALRPVEEMLVKEFRKTWLTPKEAL